MEEVSNCLCCDVSRVSLSAAAAQIPSSHVEEYQSPPQSARPSCETQCAGEITCQPHQTQSTIISKIYEDRQKKQRKPSAHTEVDANSGTVKRRNTNANASDIMNYNGVKISFRSNYQTHRTFTILNLHRQHVRIRNQGGFIETIWFKCPQK